MSSKQWKQRDSYGYGQRRPRIQIPRLTEAHQRLLRDGFVHTGFKDVGRGVRAGPSTLIRASRWQNKNVTARANK